MSSEKTALPEVGEFVVATVTRITPYGAYVTLDEYNNVEGLVHVSEISSSWVRNIRDHIREGEKTVLRVLRVDPTKLHVDLSLRRVSSSEKKEKLLQWKQDARGRKLLTMVADKLKTTPEEAYEKVGSILEDRFGSIYQALEKAAEEGDAPLLKANIPQEWATALAEVARSKIRLPRMKISGILELTSARPNGVEVLREAFSKAMAVRKSSRTSISIQTIGAPKYRIEVSAENFKEAERVLEASVQAVLKTISSNGGEGKFTRC
ncbi:MAG: translation initiation factor IF-2 subunit alpha [Candidatus Bathyarchaeia archaeon]